MKAVEERGSYLSQFRLIRPDNKAVIWLEERGHAVCGGPGEAVRLVGVVMDITERKRAESLQDGQRRVLEMVTTAAPLPGVLAAVCRVIEDQEPGLLCTLLLPDERGRHTGLAVGPSLPDAYLRGLEGLQIDPPYIGSCGEALDCGEVIVVPDVGADERFSPAWRGLLLGHGLRSCRSIPVFGADGTVLASFGVYRRETGDPEPANRQLIQVATHLTGIAIERERAERALRRSEERLRGVFNQTIAGIAETDLAGRFVQANQRYCEMVGRHAAELYGLRMQDITHPDDLPRNLPLFERAVADGTPFVVEKRYVRPDGSSFWVSNSVSLVRDGLGKPDRMVAASLDITDRKRVEEVLRDSEAHFRSMADNSPAMLWVTDPSASCTYLSQQWYEFTGRTPEQDLGLGWLENVHPDDVSQAKDTFLKANALHVPFSLDYRLRRRDGVYRWAVDAGLPRFDEAGRFQGFVGAVTDVHERKKGEERLRLLWEAAAILLSTDDPDAMMRGLFSKVSQHLGVDAYLNYMVNETGDALRLVSCTGIPEEGARSIERLEFSQAICGTVALHRKPIVATNIQQSDDPKVQLLKSFGIRAYACNSLLAENRLIGTLSFSSRTKDHFDPEEVAFLETLCHYVTIAYERLRLVERLQEADRRKDEFLATLAHELRNPLAPVRNALQLLRRANGNGELVEQSRTIMERQVSQMVRLVDDLLDVARITRGKLELRKERVELAAVVKNAVETSRPLIEQMGHELTVTLPPQPVYLDADPVRVSQVFLNLLNNAAKYTEQGGHIWLIAKRRGSDAVVTVKDTGVGIPADKLPHVFDTFTQVEKSLDRSQGGLGLGLTLVKRLTEMHGGSVEAKSGGPGKGSEFTVRLPVAPSPAAAEPPPTEETIATPRHRILVVDDNRDGADSLAMMLRMLGNRAQTAYDGIEAVQVADGFRPEVVLLDIGLPKLNGYEACRRIREQPWGKGMALIAVTGWGQDEDKRRALEAGFNFHMVKPVNPADLEKLLAGLLLTPV